MALEPPIFLLAAALVAATGSAALFAEWTRNRAADSLLWWAASLALAATGFILFVAGGDQPDSIARMLGTYATLGASGAALSATRRLHGRSPNLLGLVIGPTIWLGISAKLGQDFTGRVVVNGTLQAMYAIATAFEMYRGGRARAPEFRTAAAIMLAVGFLQLLRAVAGRALVGQPVNPGLHGQWVVPTATVAAFYAAALAFLVLRGFRRAGQTPGPLPVEAPPSRSRVLP